jgi:hypothetical protein
MVLLRWRCEGDRYQLLRQPPKLREKRYSWMMGNQPTTYSLSTVEWEGSWVQFPVRPIFWSLDPVVLVVWFSGLRVPSREAGFLHSWRSATFWMVSAMFDQV